MRINFLITGNDVDGYNASALQHSIVTEPATLADIYSIIHDAMVYHGVKRPRAEYVFSIRCISCATIIEGHAPEVARGFCGYDGEWNFAARKGNKSVVIGVRCTQCNHDRKQRLTDGRRIGKFIARERESKCIT